MVECDFTGVIVPMVTPLTAEERVDSPSVRRLVDFLVAGGVDGIFILGSMGEGPMLRPSVRHELAEVTVESAAGRVPVIAGALEPSTARTVEELGKLKGRGLQGYVATTPYYFGGYNNEELLNHFTRIADSVDLPILLYNIPQNTKVPFGADLIMKLSETPNIAGLKDTSGDWPEVQTLLTARKNRDFKVLQGNQSYMGISMLAGADGVVPGHGNVYPQLLVELTAAGRKGDIAATMACQTRLDRLLRMRGRAPQHTLKLVLKAMGLTEDYVSSPLPRLNPQDVAGFLASSAAAGLPFQDYKSG